MSGQDSVLDFLVNHGSTVGVVVLASLTTLAGMFLNRPARHAVKRPRPSAKEENIMEYMCDVRLGRPETPDCSKTGCWNAKKDCLQTTWAGCAGFPYKKQRLDTKVKSVPCLYHVFLID